jgi:hypothetical protein
MPGLGIGPAGCPLAYFQQLLDCFFFNGLIGKGPNGFTGFDGFKHIHVVSPVDTTNNFQSFGFVFAI